MPERREVKDPLSRTPYLQATTRPNFYMRGGGATPPAKTNSALQLAEALSTVRPLLAKYVQKDQEESAVEGQASLDLANLTGEVEIQRKGFKQARKDGDINEKADIFYWRGRAHALGQAQATHTLRNGLTAALRNGELDDFENPNQVLEVVGELSNQTQESLNGDTFALQSYSRAANSIITEFARKADAHRNGLFVTNTLEVHKAAFSSNLEAAVDISTEEGGTEAAQEVLRQSISDLRTANIENPSKEAVAAIRTHIYGMINDGQSAEAQDFLDDIEDTEIYEGATLGKVAEFQSLVAYADQKALQDANDASRQWAIQQAEGTNAANEDFKNMESVSEEAVAALIENARQSDMSAQKYAGYQEEMNTRLRNHLSEPDPDNAKQLSSLLTSYQLDEYEALKATSDLSEDQRLQLEQLEANVKGAVGIVDQGQLLQSFQQEFFGYTDRYDENHPPALDAEAQAVYQNMTPEDRDATYEGLFNEWVDTHRKRIVDGGFETQDLAQQSYPAILNELSEDFPKWVNEKIKAKKPVVQQRKLTRTIQDTVKLTQKSISIERDIPKQLAQPQYRDLPNSPEELLGLVDEPINYPTTQAPGDDPTPTTPFRRFFFSDRDAAYEAFYDLNNPRFVRKADGTEVTREELVDNYIADGVKELNKRVKDSEGTFNGPLKNDINVFIERAIDLGQADKLKPSDLKNWALDPDAVSEAKPGKLSNKQVLEQRTAALEKYYLTKYQQGLTPQEYLTGVTEDDIPLPPEIDFKTTKLFSNITELEEAWNGGQPDQGGLFMQVAQKVAQHHDTSTLQIYLVQRMLLTR